MTNKHEIEIEDLPDGWMAVAYRFPVKNVDYVLAKGSPVLCYWDAQEEWLIVEKIQPRRIVLEETRKDANEFTPQDIEIGDEIIRLTSTKIWCVVEDC